MIDALSKYLPEKEEVRNYYEDCKERLRKRKLEKSPAVTVIAQTNGFTLAHIPSEIPLDEIKINGVPPSKGQIGLANTERINKGDKITLAAKYADLLLAGYNNPKFRGGVVSAGPSGLTDAFPEETYLSRRSNREEYLTPRERRKLRKWKAALRMITHIDGKRLPAFVPDNDATK